MFFRLIANAALVSGAAFIYSVNSFAQAPIVDASVESRGASGSQAGAGNSNIPAPAQDAGGQGELFYQLQLLQQEVMQLRGQVEEQSYQLQQIKNQSMERYIDLDRRIGEISSGNPGSSQESSGSPAVKSGPQAVTVVAKAGEKEAYDKAYGMVISKQFSGALDAFKQYLVDYPDGKYAANAYYWMGELYQVVNPADLNAAREVFTQLLSQYPDHAKAPDAMYKLGKVYFLLGNRAASKEWLEKVIATYSSGPNASAADKARQFLNANL